MTNEDKEQIRAISQEEIRKYASDSKYNVVSIPAHSHTGIDSDQISADKILNLNPPAIRRVFSTTSTGNWATGSLAVVNTFIPNANMVDLFDLASATGAITFSNPVGSPANGQILEIRVTSSNSATARSLTFSSSTGGYIANSPALPSATTTGKTLMIGFMYDTTGSLNKWRLFYSANA